MTNVVAIVLSVVALMVGIYVYFHVAHVPAHVALSSRMHTLEVYVRSRCVGDKMQQACATLSTKNRPVTLETLMGGDFSE